MNNNDCEECKKLRNLLHRERHFSNELHNKININQASHAQLNNEIFELKAQIKKMEMANNILNKIIYAFVANNYRYDEEEGYWIVLDNDTFECDSTARQAFISIINQIKEKFNNENNN